jgi:hypothetical protein
VKEFRFFASSFCCISYREFRRLSRLEHTERRLELVMYQDGYSQACLDFPPSIILEVC